jgi:hypothetical protein
MKKENTKFAILNRIDEEIKEAAAEIHSGLSPEEKKEEAAELAELYEEDITQRIYELFDNLVMYYRDAAEIVADLGYWNGWEDLQMLGGELPNNISQLAYAAIYEEAINEGLLYGYSWAFEEVKEEVQKLKEELNEAKQ